MHRPQCYDEFGRPIPYDDDDVVPDGGSVRIPLMFADASPDERKELRKRYNIDPSLDDLRAASCISYLQRSERISNAWQHDRRRRRVRGVMNPPPVKELPWLKMGDDDDPRTLSPEDLQARLEDARAQRKLALANRWRHP
jgi:hypothetical protein